MKARTINIIILVVIFISCKNKTTGSEQVDNKQTSELKENIEPEFITQPGSTELKPESTDKIPEFLAAKYSRVYEYNGTDSRQLIGINFIAKDSIGYYLISESLPCDTEYHGKAFNQNYGLDPEIDEDEDGISYPAFQYSDNLQDHVIYIRVALDSSKVKIEYTGKEADGTDCVPNTLSIMERIK
ncbi:hypothetical protein NE848_10715 [Gramella jeungdoensis]|uniref:Uncharacterized protein n=1 Tax=Gramella jeungdoensis TaxID=708091 RepID=A0ABT0Z2B1_9FLAO|nr:hypothetical protein [Gramella jeungdoensis]MCM8569854.1 hypothetical protein [Gramella jeungdoensis]